MVGDSVSAAVHVTMQVVWMDTADVWAVTFGNLVTAPVSFFYWSLVIQLLVRGVHGMDYVYMMSIHDEKEAACVCDNVTPYVQ